MNLGYLLATAMMVYLALKDLYLQNDLPNGGNNVSNWVKGWAHIAEQQMTYLNHFRHSVTRRQKKKKFKLRPPPRLYVLQSFNQETIQPAPLFDSNSFEIAIDTAASVVI